jgi:RsiW-degrading membrane proteinase PrsW (M82 family)
MESDTWRAVLIAGLLVNACAGLGYRVYRLSKGGPRSDVVGQAILGGLLVGLALALVAGAGWPRWPALVYGLLFGVAVMPLWVLAVLIPLRPGPIDYAFTALYWMVLATIVIAALGL